MFRQFSQIQAEAKDVNGDAALPAVVGIGDEIEALPAFNDHDPRGTFWIDLKTRLHERLLDMLNLSAIEKVAPSDLRREVSTIVNQLLSKEGVALNAKEFQQIVEEILDEVLGLGPLEPLLKDPNVGDILVNTHNHVYVERQGRLEITSVRFKDERHLLRIIDKIVSAVGRRVDESQPWVDARLPDGSRVNAIVPPCALDGPLLSIRKFGQSPMTIEKLIDKGALTPPVAHVLQGITRARLNLIISGGTGSGKTTMLNAVSSFIGNRERIITIEDAAELQLQQFHVVRMETRPPNIEGRGAVTQRELLRNALRMRPDRIIVGEVRGAEALDMLQAMNTGHDGSMTTIHANTPRDALSRLEQMIMMTGVQFPLHSMRAQLASAIDVVIQLERMADGKRRMVSLQEITGMERDVVTMQEIFSYKREGIDEHGAVVGHFEASGVRPKFADRLRSFGVELPGDLFSTKRKL
ncbi:MAG: CpaF family protein [Alphaproteobacteria bacterium]|nr:CpaF family protein [Alphaproteobacteria bacterium]